MSRLTKDDWTRAALDALSAGGLTAVAVEPLAARLNATKGSFYWHFRNRDELVMATLDLWRHTSTTSVIALLESSGAPARTRIRQLFLQAFAPHTHNAANLALLAAADHPLVAPVIVEVTRQRLDYLTDLFRDLGHPEDRARQRAVFAYSAFIGQLQLARTVPDLLPSAGAATDAYADDVLAALTS